jgi:hypothetical protein
MTSFENPITAPPRQLYLTPSVMSMLSWGLQTPPPASQVPTHLSSSTQSPLFRDLFLEDASRVHRTIPGCAPAPRLVGIETNPGPRSRGGRKPMVLVTAAPPPSRSRRRPRRSRQPLRPGPSVLASYRDTLLDPWEFGPLTMGYDCMVNTVLATGYRRSSFTVNADGSFGLVFFPACGSSVLVNNAGLGLATWTASSLSNASTIVAQGNEGRVVSAGLRAFALFPSTSASGVLAAGSMGSNTTGVITTYTPQNLFDLPSSKLGFGGSGARAVSLPIDSDSFTFYTAPVGTYGSSSYSYSSVPYIAGQGFPAGTVVWFEAVLNLELLPNVSVNTLGIDPTSGSITETLSSVYATAERLVAAVRPLIGESAVVMDGVAGLATSAASVASAVGSVRSAFGRGRNMLAAGTNAARQSIQSTAVLEEMKEDGRWTNVPSVFVAPKERDLRR